MPTEKERKLEDLLGELDGLLELRAGKTAGWRVRCDHVGPDSWHKLFLVNDEHDVELGRAATLYAALQAAITGLRASARRMARSL